MGYGEGRLVEILRGVERERERDRRWVERETDIQRQKAWESERDRDK